MSVVIKKINPQSVKFSGEEEFIESKGFYQIRDKDKRLWDSSHKIEGPVEVDYILGRVKFDGEFKPVNGKFHPTVVVSKAEKFDLSMKNKSIVSSDIGQRYSKNDTRPLEIELKVWQLSNEDSINSLYEDTAVVFVKAGKFSGLLRIVDFDFGELELVQSKPEVYKNYSWGD